MKIIIDTHIFLWALADPGKIEPHKRTELETVANTVYVSSIRKPKEPAAALRVS
jgi:PIN domain nuclease of toxin-antitoxin system